MKGLLQALTRKTAAVFLLFQKPVDCLCQLEKTILEHIRFFPTAFPFHLTGHFYIRCRIKMHELFTFRPGTFNQSHPMNRAVSYTIDLVYKVPAGIPLCRS